MSRKSLTDQFKAFTFDQPIAPSTSIPIEIPVSKIHPSPLQYRKFYDPDEVEAIGRSLLEKQIQPIAVRPKPGASGDYELVFGQKRLLGCQVVMKQTIFAYVENLTDEEVMTIALTENIHRSNPNPVEEAHGLIRLIQSKSGMDQKSLTQLLNQFSRGGDSADNVVRRPEWGLAVAILSQFKLTPESFRKNRLPLLSLPDDVLHSLEAGKIEYTKALAIARIADQDQRASLLISAESGLTLQEIKEQVKPAASSISPIAQQIKTLTPRLKKFNPDADKKKAAKIAALLSQLNDLLS